MSQRGALGQPRTNTAGGVRDARQPPQRKGSQTWGREFGCVEGGSDVWKRISGCKGEMGEGRFSDEGMF